MASSAGRAKKNLKQSVVENFLKKTAKALSKEEVAIDNYVNARAFLWLFGDEPANWGALRNNYFHILNEYGLRDAAVRRLPSFCKDKAEKRIHAKFKAQLYCWNDRLAAYIEVREWFHFLCLLKTTVPKTMAQITDLLSSTKELRDLKLWDPEAFEKVYREKQKAMDKAFEPFKTYFVEQCGINERAIFAKHHHSKKYPTGFAQVVDDEVKNFYRQKGDKTIVAMREVIEKIRQIRAFQRPGFDRPAVAA
jgi:hypothetical protein